MHSAPFRLASRFTLIVLLALLGGLVAACTSGLEGTDPGATTEQAQEPESTNLRFSFDPGLRLSNAVEDVQVAGGVLPVNGGSGERPISFVAFVTRSNADDGDAAGTPLDADATPDTNGDLDVFLAAVDCAAVDPRAFTYSMAGTMRHPRCVTCHQMNVDVVADPLAAPPTAFMTQDHFPDGGGAPPLNQFNDSTCKTCHFPDWFSPGPTFDLRGASTRELFLRAQVPPEGLEEHFSTDARVLWALGSGQTPFGGAADDDHDGIDEPEDRDGQRRHAPGGVAGFLRRLDGWLETADPITGELKYSSSEDAVQDITLVSRNDDASAAGNGASLNPSLVYVPNPAFDVMSSDPTVVPFGTVFVAFQSRATDMVDGGANGVSDIFRVEVDVHLDAMGEVDLRYRNGVEELVSFGSSGSGGDGTSSDPSIGGDGNRIAFVSQATDMVPGFTGMCRSEVYLWDEATGLSLVSHIPASSVTPGDGGSLNPRISSDGEAVAFESDASDLVAGDTNGTRDVFYALWPALDPIRASLDPLAGEFTGEANYASVHHDAGRVKVAFAVQNGALASPPEGACAATTTTMITASKDHTLYGPSGSPTALSSSRLLVGRTNAGDNRRRGLVEFDLSSIPDGSIITGVTLTLQLVTFRAGAPTRTVQVRRVTSDWGAGTGIGLQGGTAAAGDVTWANRFHPSTPWGAFGGDFLGASASTGVTSSLGPKVWSGAGLIADVQGWLDDPASNHGWILLTSPETTVGNAVRFGDTTSATPPRLTIDYTAPVIERLGAVATDSDVFLFDSDLGGTVQLNQITSLEGTTPAEELAPDGQPLEAAAFRPVLSPMGNAVLFETSASNLDVVRSGDENRIMDVVLVDLNQFDAQGLILPYTLSVTPDGGASNGASHSARIAEFRPPTDTFPLGLAVFATEATNLSDSDPADLDGDGQLDGDNFVVSFLREAATVLADFEANPEEQGMNRVVSFEDRSSGQPSTFTWDFGDGSAPSTRREPTHVYTTPGTYTVTLTVSGELGTDDRTRTDYVRVLDTVAATFSTSKSTTSAPTQAEPMDVPDATPIVGAIDDANASSAVVLTLDSSASTNNPTEFTWTLRRVNQAGNPIGSPMVVSQQANPEINVDSVGRYDLTLSATGVGGTGTATQRVEVYQAVDADFTPAPGPLTMVTGMAAPTFAVAFNDATSGDVASGGYLWNFGDGTTSTLADPTHVFNPGAFPVTLTTTGAGGDSSTSDALTVIAVGDITAAFSITPNQAGARAGILNAETIHDALAPLPMDLTSLSQAAGGGPISTFWDLGVLTAPGPIIGFSYVPADAENVEVLAIRMVASTQPMAPGNCVGAPAGTCDEAFGSLTIYPRPQISITPSAAMSSGPMRPQHLFGFTATVTGDGATTDPLYRWLRSAPNQTGTTIEFATGVLNPTFEFDDAGVYEIALEVETNGPGGRMTTLSAPVMINVQASNFSTFHAQAIDPSTGSRCTTCHSGANPPADLDWTGTPGEVWNRIVETAGGAPIFSNNCNTANRLIEPGDAVASVIYNVLTNPSGSLCNINMRVNLPGDEAAKEAHVATLRSWISGGALND